MPAKTYAHSNAVIDHFLRNSAQTSPTTVYFALFTVAPTQSGGGTEVTGGSYARIAATFGAPANGVSSNSAPVTFPTATASWGTVVAAGIFDALSGGNLLYYGTLGTPKTVGNGDSISFASAAFAVTEQ
jgi:hypothetical protein